MSSFREWIRYASELRSRRVLFVALGAALASSACDIQGPCAAVQRHGIYAKVIDAQTGAFAAYGATGTLRDGGYTEIMEVPLPFFPDTTARDMLGARDRRGRYDILIEKPGYQPWERRGVRVVGEGCTVRTEYITVELQPSGA
jgi:hypothetical protein